MSSYQISESRLKFISSISIPSAPSNKPDLTGGWKQGYFLINSQKQEKREENLYCCKGGIVAISEIID